MAGAYKILGQRNPRATDWEIAYTVPSGKSAVLSTVSVADFGGTATTFRLAVADAGQAVAGSQYLAYDTPISPNDVIHFTGGFTLGAGAVVRVYSIRETITFNVFGEEIT